jgi:hypothetical protein
LQTSSFRPRDRRLGERRRLLHGQRHIRAGPDESGR